MTRNAFLAVAYLAAAAATATAAGDLPPIRMEPLCTPVKTSRIFQTAWGPNPRGGWNFIGQSMNYKPTGDKEKVTIDLGNGRRYLAYADTTARPEAEWVILDVGTGAQKIVNLPGFHAPEVSGGGCLAGNGRVFFSVDYGHIYYYEPAEETIQILGRIHDDIGVLRVFYKLELGPDGMVYGASQSTNGLASVIRINPDTLEWKYITGVGLPGRRSLTYGYYIAMEPPWIYVGVGQGKWELCAVNFDTGEKRVLDQREGDDSRVTVAQGEDYCTAQIHGAPERVNVALRDGRIVARAKHGEKLEYAAPPKAYKMVEWKQTRPLDLGAPPQWDRERRPAVTGQGEATLYWRPAGAADWREARFAVKNTEPAAIESLTLLPDGSLLGSCEQYHGWFRCHPEAGRCEHYGRGGPSGAKTALLDGKVYFAGYPNTNLNVFDPAMPWTNAKPGQPGDVNLNPAHLGSQGQGRSEAHHAVAMVAAKGRVYTLGQRERWSTGAGLCRYDPATKQFLALGQENKDLEPVHMMAMPFLERIVLSGAKKSKDAQLIVYDLDLRETGRIEIRAGLENTGYLLPLDDRRFMGWYPEPDAEQTTVYVYDLSAAQLVRSARVEGKAIWLTHRGEDRAVWLLNGDVLARVAPETLDVTPVGRLEAQLDMPSRGGRSVHRSRPLWRGKALFGARAGTALRSGPIE